MAEEMSLKKNQMEQKKETSIVGNEFKRITVKGPRSTTS